MKVASLPKYRSGRIMIALMLREMSTTYGRSPGGYLWAIMDPVAAVVLLSFAFSLLLRAPSLGTSFLLFYAAGYLPFNLYNMVANTTSRALRFSRELLAYPDVTFVDALFARFILNTLTQLIVFIVVISGILAVIDTTAILDYPQILHALFLASILGLGLGTLNAFLFEWFPAWMQVWSILTRPLFLASGIFYIFEDLPRVAQDLLWYNPLFHVTGLMRAGFYPSYRAAYASTLFVMAIALIALVLGLLLLRKHYRNLGEL
ncbi:ABC transporter permease [Shimia abyssi]|uniref:Transport permease protein n=1 Tax=Shimia abyssi TaxID=1662395 RepID=A0A2P8F7B2_9RHOB|nr:ABC transporter permease [Shimia abyssi]PSL17606.1 capsular polysaccharide transport system permease protein [Shimia abyssi]